MSNGRSRIYIFRSPNDDGPEYSGFDPYRKLKFIIAFIAILFLINLALTGSKSVITTLIESLITIPIIIISLCFHEFSHAWMADFLGDPTPRNMGRLSLDPRRHLDFMGTLLLFFANFGWAKPVPVNPDNFRIRDRAMMTVALAGPLSNIFLAILGGMIFKIITLYNTEVSWQILLFRTYFGMGFIYLISINLSLAFFNLIPLPPLDGSKVLNFFLSPRQKIKFQEFEQMGPLILILMVSFGMVGLLLTPLVQGGMKIILQLFFGF